MADEKLEKLQAHVHACAVCPRANERANDFCEEGRLLLFDWTDGKAPIRVTEVEVVASITYRSGKKVTYDYSNAQRPISAVDSVNSVNYATDATYAPHGVLDRATYGAVVNGFPGINETYDFTKRLQLSRIFVSSPAAHALDLSYDFTFLASNGVTLQNNGTVALIVNGRDPGRTQRLSHYLNRL